MAVLQLKLEEIHGLGAMGVELRAFAGRTEKGDWKTNFVPAQSKYNKVVKVL